MRHVVLVLFVSAVLATTVSSVAAAEAEVLRPPVDAPVLDPFRLPSGPYGRGNRGIEYDTAAGVAVVAAAVGRVVFVGPVGGVVRVSVDHGGGVVTSYGPLRTATVRLGALVSAGERLGDTAGPVHFSTRVDDEYVDPAGLLGVREVSVRLVDHGNDDHPEALALRAAAERAELSWVFGSTGSGGPGLLERIRAAGSALADLVMDPASATARLALTEFRGTVEAMRLYGGLLDPERAAERLLPMLAAVLHPPECTDLGGGAAPRPPSERRVAITFDGLDSSSHDAGALAALDLSSLGYDVADVVRFSYRGGLTPGRGGPWADAIPRTHYESPDTRAGLEPAIAAAVEVITAVSAANPGVPIDVYGHSLGGVVARHALARLDGVVAVDTAVTIASPHGGAPLADIASQLGGGPAPLEVALAAGWPEFILLAPTTGDLSRMGFAGDHADVAFPASTTALTIGQRGDVIVPASMASAPGAAHVVLGGGFPDHDGIVGAAETRSEIVLALADLPPACTDWRDRTLDAIVPEAIRWAENTLGASVLAAGLPTGSGAAGG